MFDDHFLGKPDIQIGPRFESFHPYLEEIEHQGETLNPGNSDSERFVF